MKEIVVENELVTLEVIEKVSKHPNADRLDIVNVAGYQCVTQKDLYEEGDLVAYIRTDTVLPDAEWAKPYKQYSPNRVKAVKLRGEWSEGIIVPIKEVLNSLGVQKYEAPAPQQLDAKGGLPYDIPKTDEQRFENFRDKDTVLFDKYLMTLKIDGQSATYGYKLDEDRFFVTSRNLELKQDYGNNYNHVAELWGIKEKLIEYCKKVGKSLAIRGEVYGKSIQSGKHNPHSKKPKNIAFFSMWDIDERRYYRAHEKPLEIIEGEIGLPVVPTYGHVILTPELIKELAEGEHRFVKGYEGVVLQGNDFSLKIINKNYDSRK